MGLLTHVKPDLSILPSEFRHLDAWQTKDVVDPFMETLHITAQGELIHEWHDYEWVDAPDSMFGGYMNPVKQHMDTLDFHGDMLFYTDKVDLIARFTDGRLQWVKSDEYKVLKHFVLEEPSAT